MEVRRGLVSLRRARFLRFSFVSPVVDHFRFLIGPSLVGFAEYWLRASDSSVKRASSEMVMMLGLNRLSVPQTPRQNAPRHRQRSG